MLSETVGLTLYRLVSLYDPSADRDTRLNACGSSRDSQTDCGPNMHMYTIHVLTTPPPPEPHAGRSIRSHAHLTSARAVRRAAAYSRAHRPQLETSKQKRWHDANCGTRECTMAPMGYAMSARSTCVRNALTALITRGGVARRKRSPWAARARAMCERMCVFDVNERVNERAHSEPRTHNCELSSSHSITVLSSLTLWLRWCLRL